MKTTKRNKVIGTIVEIIAERRGVSKSMVYKTINGVRKNEAVMEDYVDMTLQANKLIREAKRLVPFHENTPAV